MPPEPKCCPQKTQIHCSTTCMWKKWSIDSHGTHPENPFVVMFIIPNLHKYIYASDRVHSHVPQAWAAGVPRWKWFQMIHWHHTEINLVLEMYRQAAPLIIVQVKQKHIFQYTLLRIENIPNQGLLDTLVYAGPNKMSSFHLIVNSWENLYWVGLPCRTSSGMQQTRHLFSRNRSIWQPHLQALLYRQEAPESSYSPVILEGYCGISSINAELPWHRFDPPFLSIKHPFENEDRIPRSDFQACDGSDLVCKFQQSLRHLYVNFVLQNELRDGLTAMYCILILMSIH